MSEKKDKLFLFAWRDALRSENGPESGTTRFVLLMLSTYMGEDGGSCFPSISTLAKNTRLSRRCVHEHIDIAVKKGWITKKKGKYRDKRWRRNEYHAIIPKKIDKMLTEGKHPNEGVNPDEQGDYLDAQAVNPDSNEVLTEGRSITSYNTSNNTSCEKPAQSQEGPLDDFSAEPITPKQFAELKNQIKKNTHKNIIG